MFPLAPQDFDFVTEFKYSDIRLFHVTVKIWNLHIPLFSEGTWKPDISPHPPASQIPRNPWMCEFLTRPDNTWHRQRVVDPPAPFLVIAFYLSIQEFWMNAASNALLQTWSSWLSRAQSDSSNTLCFELRFLKWIELTWWYALTCTGLKGWGATQGNYVQYVLISSASAKINRWQCNSHWCYFQPICRPRSNIKQLWDCG